MVLIIAATACASQSGSPLVSIKQLSAGYAAAHHRRRWFAGRVRDRITNSFDDPVLLRLRLKKTVGDSGAYSMQRVRHAFSHDIAPHAVATVGLRAWVQTLLESETGVVSSATSVRGVARFNSAAGNADRIHRARSMKRAWPLALLLLAFCSRHETQHPNVLLITLDTFRADRIGAIDAEPDEARGPASGIAGRLPPRSRCRRTRRSCRDSFRCITACATTASASFRGARHARRRFSRAPVIAPARSSARSSSITGSA